LGEEDKSDQTIDSRMQVSFLEYFTMRFGWVRGKRKYKAEARSVQRRERGDFNTDFAAGHLSRLHSGQAKDAEKSIPRAQAEACAPWSEVRLRSGDQLTALRLRRGSCKGAHCGRAHRVRGGASDSETGGGRDRWSSLPGDSTGRPRGRP